MRLNRTIRLQSFQGACGFEGANKKTRAAKRLLLSFRAPLGHTSSVIPKEIDEFMGELREHPLLKHDFPLVELGELKWQPARGRADALAEFTVVCLPKLEAESKTTPAARH